VVTHELEAVTCGKEVSEWEGGGVEVGVVTEAEIIWFDVKNDSGVMSVDIGTSSILLAKLDPFRFFLSERCFFSVLLGDELRAELPLSFFSTEARVVVVHP
jgi:hypothetical protein